MTLEEIRKAKAALEEDLRKAIHPLLSAFAAETGCPVTGINTRISLLYGLEGGVDVTELTSVSVEIETGL